MKKIIHLAATLTAITFLFSCSETMLPLKGKYSDKPFELISDKSVDSVWSNIIDLFATNGLSIKVIDKSSGLIVAGKTLLTYDYTFEDENGKLKNPNASVVLSKISWMGEFITPEKIAGDWNVRIKATANSKTIINVNLVNIEATRHYSQSQYTAEKNFLFQGRSTGKFEELIADKVK